MKRCVTIISIIAFLVAVASVIIAITAYFKNREFISCCDDEDFMDFDDEDLDYFSAEMEDLDSCECGDNCACAAEQTDFQEEPQM